MISVGFFNDACGRKKGLYAIWICMVASVLAESLAKTWWAWLIAKVRGHHSQRSIHLIKVCSSSQILAGMGVGGMQVSLWLCPRQNGN